jgi:hypothetical protein
VHACSNIRKLSEVHIGEDQFRECLQEISNPKTALGERMHALVHEIGLLALELQRAQLEHTDEVEVSRVPAQPDEGLLRRLEAGSGAQLYRGPLLERRDL